MANVSYKLKDLDKRTIKIGYVGENDHMHVLIDCKEVFDEYPAAMPTMAIVPPEGEDYPKAVTRNGNIVEWLVKNSDVAAEGDGEFQLTFTEDNVVKKSVTGRFRVERSISGSGTAPSGIDDWLTDANEALTAVEAATQDAENAAEHQPKINTSGYWEIWDAETGTYVATTVKAQGDKGDPGDPGSPGDPTELIDDTAGEGDTGKTWSADKLDDQFGGVLTAINSRPETKNTTESDSDIDVTDESGNVIVRFAHGEVQTKNFNSSKIAGQKITTENSADFDLVDVMGNVLARFSGGHILTKNFDSSNIVANGYLKGKVIVNFGDSIFGNKRPPKDISTTIANETGATVYNCGFGGCRMAKHDSSRLSTWGKFSMWELADAIASNDFTGQESAIENFPVSEMPAYFPETLALLESIDFSTVDIVTIAYGTNDFTASVLVDDENDKYSTSTFAGALRYSIEALLGTYPNLRIVCCGQCYRWWDNAGVFVDDSNTHEVGGQLLTQFVSKTEDVAKEYNLQFINNYDIGIGKFTRSYFFTGTDTTHPNDIGTKLIARHIVRELY